MFKNKCLSEKIQHMELLLYVKQNQVVIVVVNL